MMIGPAPMMRMLSRSVRFPTASAAFRGFLLLHRRASARIRLDALDHQVHEMLEQQPQIVRPRARLRMTLKAEGRPVGAGYALEGAVEERAVCGTQILRERALVHREAVVLARDEHAARVKLRH